MPSSKQQALTSYFGPDTELYLHFKKIYKEQAGQIKPELPLLRRGLILVIIGVLRGLLERNLDPQLESHKIIFDETITEIRKIYAEMPHPPQQETWFPECYEYGISKAYHLDWKLYMSKELY